MQSEYGGSVEAVQPDAAILAAAAAALAAVDTRNHGELAYARVDGVVSAGRLLIMELELIEPFLFLAGQAHAAERLARHLAQRLNLPPAAAQRH